jgi:hypothetical protein
VREEAQTRGVNALSVKRRATCATSKALAGTSSPDGCPNVISDGCEIYDRIVIG